MTFSNACPVCLAARLLGVALLLLEPHAAAGALAGLLLLLLLLVEAG
jgi:hypothetical protein